MQPDQSDPGNSGAWGSDIIADALREQQVPYVALVPGASFRGLHDSLVNHLGNEMPRILVCLHEEHCVSIAHGWALVTDTPMATMLHTNVGLMHATMAIFNAWCDRVPMLIVGASGPFDTTKRRPWIDWLHSAADLGALVRDYTKWDDAPNSPAAAVESIRRAAMVTRTSPFGPVYVNLDIAMQEDWIAPVPDVPPLENYRSPAPPSPSADDIERAYDMLDRARAPLMMIGRVTRDSGAWTDRVQLAEAFGARVLSLYNTACGFPRAHPLHCGVSRLTLDDASKEALASSDLVLSLNWTDLGGTVAQLWPDGQGMPPIISVSDEFHLHRGWSSDYHRLSPAALRIGTAPAPFAAALLERARNRPAATDWEPSARRGWSHDVAASGEIGIRDLAAVLVRATADIDVSLVSRPIGWPHTANRVEHPLDFLGAKGGEGLGAGPGMLVGAALALRDAHPSRLPVSVVGDGDFMMGASALWTAASERIPLLCIVANNRAYYNDVVHQERIARRRGRPVENKWVGIAIDDPAPDIAQHAASLGLESAVVSDLSDLPGAIDLAIGRVRDGASYVLEVRIVAGQAH